MPPPQTPGSDNISLISSARKRLQPNGGLDEPDRSFYSKSSAPLSLSLIDVTTSHSKRVKLSSNDTTFTRERNMVQGVTIGTRPQELRPSAFEPHRGAKKLVIKNLKDHSQDLEKYYADTWKDLDAAVTAILHGEKPRIALEQLHRGVEMTCRRGKAGALFEHLKMQCKTYVEKELLPSIQSSTKNSDVEILRTVYDHWTIWHKRTKLIRSLFSSLDRSYLLNSKDLPQLEDLSIQQFRHAVFGKGKPNSARHQLGESVISGICDLVTHDRLHHADFDAVLLKDSISMLHIFGNYEVVFEPIFIRQSADFLNEFVKERSTSSLKSYVADCDSLLKSEGVRCDRYNFDGSTKRKFMNLAHQTLIEHCEDILFNVEGVAKLIDNNDIASLKTLYQLLKLSQIHVHLRTPFEIYIKKVGGTIISDKEKIDSMVVQLLELKRMLDVVIRDAFDRDEVFTFGLREAFGNFMNDRRNTSALGSSNSKVGEMIAKYMDLLLRGGVKAVPRSLAFDEKDRATAEREGQASTGDEDAELDRQLEQGLELFRFIEGKDVFEAFYKKDLARRLLMARSASQDAERNMLAKLKVECGTSFTHNLEQMFKDQELSKDEMISYKQHLLNTSRTTMDLQVSVLSAAAWPTYPDVEVRLPSEVAKHIEKYDRHYKNKHSGRRLTWKHALAHSVVRATFAKGTKELLVSAFQAIVLVLFNDISNDGNLSYTAIATATGLPDAELIRTLQSLACAKFRVLTKHPKGREVNPTDTFTVNLGFTDPKFRIKINQIQLKETKEENTETHERVFQDRQYETQAAIVRIMKQRKMMTHQNLVAEVIEQTRKRGAVELGEIKKNIEKLIEKDYIDREGANYVYQA